MHILYLANSRFPTMKAHGVQIMKACEGFAIAGVDIELVAIRRTRHVSPDELFRFYGVSRTFPLKLLSIPDFRRFGTLGYWFESLLFIIRSMVLVYRYRAIIYSRDERLLWAFRCLGFSCVWESHDRSWNFFARRVAARSLKIVVTSERLKKFYIERGIQGTRIVVAHHGIDPAEFSSIESKENVRIALHLPPKKEIVAYIGKFKTMDKSKGVEELIEAVAALRRERPVMFLLIVGLGADEIPLVENLVRSAGYNRVDYAIVGHVLHTLIPRYMRAADILVMNYPNTEHYASVMFPLKLFEYMASGTPIVASDLPSIRDVLNEQNAVLVAPGNVDALAHGIAMTFEQYGEAHKRAQKALAVAKENTWARRARAIADSL
jgi:glycosyltransferase involved in cell wall biosynthesis